MKVLRKGATIFDRLLDAASVAAAIVLLFIMLATSFDVVTRYAWGFSLEWLLNVSEVLLVLTCFLLTAWVLRRNGHVRMELVIAKLKPRIRYLVNGITSILMIIICLTLIWFSATLSLSHYQLGIKQFEVVEIPTAPLYAIVTLGSIALVFECIRQANRYFRLWRTS